MGTLTSRIRSTNSGSMYLYWSGISRTWMGVCATSWRKSARKRAACLSSITRMTSAQRISPSVTLRRALVAVPADRASTPGTFRHTASAVGLRHWFLLHTNRMRMGAPCTLTPTLPNHCGSQPQSAHISPCSPSSRCPAPNSQDRHNPSRLPQHGRFGPTP